MTDKPTTKSEPVAQTVEDPALSTQHEFSTYAQVPPPEGVTPTPGPTVEQTLGTPTEAT
jgi:hypothetical protein